MGEYLTQALVCTRYCSKCLCILSQPSPQFYAYTMTGQQMRKLRHRKAKPPRHHSSRTRLPTQPSGSKPHVLNSKFVFRWRVMFLLYRSVCVDSLPAVLLPPTVLFWLLARIWPVGGTSKTSDGRKLAQGRVGSSGLISVGALGSLLKATVLKEKPCLWLSFLVLESAPSLCSPSKD